jgi:hypothetical protein
MYALETALFVMLFSAAAVVSMIALLLIVT